MTALEGAEPAAADYRLCSGGYTALDIGVVNPCEHGNLGPDRPEQSPVVPSVGAVPVEVPEEDRRAWWAKAGIVTDWDASGNVVSVAFSIAALREHEVRVRAEERQRILIEVRGELALVDLGGDNSAGKTWRARGDV